MRSPRKRMHIKKIKRTKNKVLGHAKFKVLRKEIKTAKILGEKLGQCGSWEVRKGVIKTGMVNFANCC